MEDLNIQFTTSNFDVDTIVGNTDEVIGAVFAIDHSGSMAGHMGEVNQAVEEAVEEWKGSHHSDKIMYSQIEFSSNVKAHGFQPIENYSYSPISAHGTTKLYEATATAIKNAIQYREDLLLSGASDVKMMVFVFTDGQNYGNYDSPSIVKAEMDKIATDEALSEDIDVILFGIGDVTDFQDACDQMGITKAVLASDQGGKTAGEFLREQVSVASKSVSAGNTSNIVI